MLIGQSLLATTSSGYTYYGPWMPRQSDKAIFVVESLLVPSGVTVQFKVESKDSEDSDSSISTPVSLSTVGAAGTPGTQAEEGVGLKELVRYVYVLTSSSGTKWAHIRANAPIAQPN